jgi:hypothetical protein
MRLPLLGLFQKRFQPAGRTGDVVRLDSTRHSSILDAANPSPAVARLGRAFCPAGAAAVEKSGLYFTESRALGSGTYSSFRAAARLSINRGDCLKCDIFS